MPNSVTSISPDTTDTTVAPDTSYSNTNPNPNPNITIQNVLPTTVPPNETKATSVTQISPTTPTTPTTSPQFVNLPDNFGASTTMAELANYFAKVVLIQMMSKFDVNTTMTPRDFISSMAKSDEKPNNSTTNGTTPTPPTTKTIGAGDFYKNVDTNPVIYAGKDYQTQIQQQGQQSTGNNGAQGMAPVMFQGGPSGSSGMGMDQNENMGDMSDMSAMDGNVIPKDKRENHDIQYDNEDISAKNEQLSEKLEEANAKKSESASQIANNNSEIEKLKNSTDANTPESQKKIKKLQDENNNHKNDIRNHEKNMREINNEIHGNNSKIKENTKELNSRKSWGQYFSEKGSSAYDSTKSIGNAASKSLGDAVTGAKKLVKGQDIDVLDTDHAKLLDQQKAENVKIGDLKQQLTSVKNLEEGDRISKEINKAEANKSNIDKQIVKNRSNYDEKQKKLNEIKKRVDKDDESVRRVPHSEVESINAGPHTHTQVSANHDMNAPHHSNNNPHLHDKQPNFFSRQASTLKNTFKRMGNIKDKHKHGGKKTKTKKNKKITKKVNIE